ncbi:hypothetical protein AUP68_13966, partial [Ilyonectria robusta]
MFPSTPTLHVLVAWRKAIRLRSGAHRHSVYPLPGACVKTETMIKEDTTQPQYSEQEGQEVTRESLPLPPLLFSPLLSA